MGMAYHRSIGHLEACGRKEACIWSLLRQTNLVDIQLDTALDKS